MKLGDMEFWRDEDGDWIEDQILYVDTLLDYIESHGLDKADETIAELSKRCDEKDEIIHRVETELFECRRKFDKRLEDKTAELSRLLDTERAFNESLLSQQEPSYKQRFIDEAAMRIMAGFNGGNPEWSWEQAYLLWNYRKEVD